MDKPKRSLDDEKKLNRPTLWACEGLENNSSHLNCVTEQSKLTTLDDCLFPRKDEIENMRDCVVKAIGNSCFNKVYELISANTPEYYYFIAIDEISDIVRKSCEQEFGELKVEIALEKLMDIYKIVFLEREMSRMVLN